MNIETAKRISIVSILQNLNIKPERESLKDAWYLSPIRKENTASFVVDKRKNRWYDYGVAIGGDALDLVCAYLNHIGRPHTTHDGLSWLDQMTGLYSQIPTLIIEQNNKETSRLKFVSACVIKNRSLLRLLEDRGISLNTGKKYLKEVRYLNTQTNTHMFALGLQNDEDGYELRSSIFKGSLKKKYLTFIRGSNEVQTSIHIFEGLFDFLAAIEIHGAVLEKNDCIILNSISFVDTSLAYISSMDYKFVHTYMDNDDAGIIAQEKYAAFIASEPSLRHVPMNKVYEWYKDVNAWHIAKLANKPEVK